ncbi:phosphatase PAP2 family protein [Zhouia sp. PK063]|uniref:phosphatase PAP2 family protein n=1 Tax=Zhouia sp. PK063 TaxID=3373602 RepID=UPI0037A46DEB
MKKILLMSLLCVTFIRIQAQSKPSPYKWKWSRDGLWTGLALGGSTYGLILIQNKKGISNSELQSLNKDDIFFGDRWVAGNYSKNADKISYIPFYAAFGAPFILFLDDGVNDHAGQVAGMYIESLATTAAVFSITAGLVNRSRPYVYNEDLPNETRTRSSGQRSFFSGHVAATATATFFAAKVYSDFNPDSPAKPYLWVGAATIPAVVGYYRMKAGQHFLSDVLLGYSLGAAVGYFIPELHKIKNDTGISFYPSGGVDQFGKTYNGLTLGYTF